MKIKGLLFILMISLTLFSCQERNNRLNDNVREIIENLSGLWKIDNANYFEEWEKKEDIYVGRSFSIEGNDTIIQETIRIYKEAEKIFYEPTVFGQNDGNPIKFELIKADSVTVIFENKAHDFPQQISYSFLSENQMTAKISGLVEGQEEIISFNFTKQ